MMRPLFATALAAACAAASCALAAEPAYLDDRSTPEALVKSLYNAIDRKEYARAYAYFDPAPAKTVDDYAKGFDGTDHVEVVTGTASGEGAAGSTYYSLPVAIQATDKDGNAKVFAGCYTLRLANPQIQAEDFKPLHIDKGSLKPSDKPLDAALPEKCGDGPPPPKKDSALETAKTKFAAAYGDICDKDAKRPEGEDALASYDIAFNYPTDPQDKPKRNARLFRFHCFTGAYNLIHIYFMADDEGAVTPLRFAEPDLDIRYVDDDPEKAVESVSVIGFVARDQMINSDYDPATYTLQADEKWRGLGDASATGKWIFRAGKFSLVRYAVDASYDGKVNPETVIDYETGP